MHPLYGVLPLAAVCAFAGYTRCFGRTTANSAEPRSTARLLFLLQYLCGIIFMTLYSMVWNWRVLRARVNVLLSLAARSVFAFFSFFRPAAYCGAVFSGLIMCLVFSSGFALPTFFNNNNIKYKNNNNNSNKLRYELCLHLYH